MKLPYKLLLFSFFIVLNAVSQQNTEVYLMDLNSTSDTLYVGKPVNISNTEGYNNQPSFYDYNSILFASTRNGQTDIALYHIKDKTTQWISNTPGGSEYSPLKIPNKEAISAIRLDTDGLQRLYQYDIKTGASKELLKNLKVGYHVWYNDHIIVSSVLIENRMDLVVSNLKDNTNRTLQKNVGRSLHNIPNTDLISFISKESDTLKVKSIHPISGATKDIVSLLDKSEDVCWTRDGSLVSAYDSDLIIYNPSKDQKWEPAHNFKEKEIYGISRLAMSPDGKHIAIVSQDAPYKIVQKQVDSYNAADLDAFVNCYSKKVVVSYFPDDTWYEGHEKMREIYAGLSPANKAYDVAVVNRITIDNKVIDLEKVTGKGKVQMQVALYEVNNGKIESMTFIFDKTSPNPETIVQQQLDAYNTRDIEGFLATYTDNVKLYNFPHKLRTDGLEAMRKGYTNFFESSPDLHCELKNRIVIGNKVIDEEYITANGNTFSAIAVYEVEDGKIAKVTFIR